VRVEWTRAAAAGLDALAEFIAERNPDAVVSQVLLTLQSVEERLPTYPGTGRPGRVPGTRELVVPDTPFIVAYRVTEGAIQVLRVLHGARRWPGQL
jgi:toxin ParE1/3/4